ncbi:MAG: DUF2029 domain-containing protein, partial [Gemmatimonadales bacterium]
CFQHLESRIDYDRFVLFGRVVNDGGLVYDPVVQAEYRGGDTNWAVWPPGFAPFASSLARMDAIAQKPTALLFQFLGLVGLFVALFVVVEWLTGRRPLASDPDRRIAWDAPVIAIAVLVPIRLVMSDFEISQVNLIILGLVVLGARLLDSRKWPGGLLIGLGSAMKATPILLLPYFIWRGRWRAFGATVFGVFIGWFALPSLWLGPGRTLEWWRAWIQTLPQAGAQYGWMNQSLLATAVRIFGLETGMAVWWAGALLLALGILIAFGRPFRQVGSRRTAAEVSTLLVAITIVSPVSWKSHYVTLVVLCAAVFIMARDVGDSRGRNALWGLALVTAGFNLSSENFIGWDANVLLQHYGVITWSSLLLVTISLILLYWDRRAPS